MLIHFPATLLFLFIFRFTGAISHSQSLSVFQKVEEEPSPDGSPFKADWNKFTTRVFTMLNSIYGNMPSKYQEKFEFNTYIVW
jgi:hypothetical protein